MLDHLASGRVILGIGRGLGRVEFDGFRDPDGRVARALRRGRRDDPRRPRARLRGVRRHVHHAARARAPAAAVQVVPRPHLRRGRLAGVEPDHGRARHRHPDHPAEAVGRHGVRARHVPRGLPRGERRRRAAADPGRAGCSATRTATAPRSSARSTSAATTKTVLDHYELSGDHLGDDEGLRVLRQDVAGAPGARRRSGPRLLRRPPGLGHAGAVLREDHGHPLDGRQRLVRDGRVVRRHADRRGRAQHAAVRRRGPAAAPGRPGDVREHRLAPYARGP